MKFPGTTAILVFANSSKEELIHKPIPKGELLFDRLTQETLKKVQKSGLPYFHISETEQVGRTFGERFSNAIQSVFERGFENIITIGNDTPQLQTRHLIETETALKAGKTVLGPSLDGGFYLMGIHKSKFDAETFERLPWQRFSLLNRIAVLLNQTEALLHTLPTLGDLDDIKDAKRLASFRRSVSSSLIQLLVLLIQLENKIIVVLRDQFSAIYLHRIFNKGSPILLHS